jgi:sterol desaturase/sphingolipid hydroxylase (fatty acid hydroxylase superfamily)
MGATMTAEELQGIRVAAFAVAMGVAVVLQRVAPHAGRGGSWRVNAALWLVSAGLVGVVCGACGFETARWAEREGVGMLNLAGAAWGTAIPATVLALDLVSYGWHRANHRVAALWRFHQVHHSDPTFTVSTGVRFHPGELLLALPVRLAAVVLLGASAEAVVVFEVLFAAANLVEHGDIDLPRRLEGRLATTFVTPALHRRHHTRKGAARDTNYGTIFSVWDRVFRSFTPSDSATEVPVGLPGLRHVTFARALILPLGTFR